MSTKELVERLRGYSGPWTVPKEAADELDRLKQIEGEYYSLSQDDGKKDREIARLTDRLVQAEDEVCNLHRIGSLEVLKRIAAECAKRDYCSCAPLEMSYCVTERFVKRLEEQAARLVQAEALLREAVNSDAYNRGAVFANIDAFLVASGEQK